MDLPQRARNFRNAYIYKRVALRCARRRLAPRNKIAFFALRCVCCGVPLSAVFAHQHCAGLHRVGDNPAMLKGPDDFSHQQVGNGFSL